MNLGTLAYGLVAGASMSIGMIFIVLSIGSNGSRVKELCVGSLGLLAGSSAIATLRMQTSDDVAQYGAIMKGSFTYTALATVCAAVWVVAVITRVGWPRFPAMFTVATVGLGIVSILSDGGLIVESVTGLRNVTLLGEPFVVHVANRSTWRLLLDGWLLGFATYLVVALFLNHRRAAAGQRVLLIGLAIAFLLSQYDSLVDEGIVNTPYLAPFGLIAFVIGLAIQHAAQVTETKRALSQQTMNLEELVFARTESLHAANARVLDELGRQEWTVGRLTRLTRQSIALDSLGGDDATSIEAGLAGALGAIVDIVGAGSANLEVDRSAPSILAGLSIDRRALNRPESTRGNRVEELEFPLRSGERLLGKVVFRTSARGQFSTVQTQLAKLSAELLTAALRRFELESALVAAVVDDERRRIARDLHDSFSQRLYAAAFHAEVLINGEAQDPQVVVAQTQTIRDLLLSSMAEMRTLLFELQPDTFEGTSLNGLIEQLCVSMGEIYGRHIVCTSQPGPTLPPETKLAFYRIAQETLGNALRHSDAQNILVSIDVSDVAVSLAVTDDGIGFEPDELVVGHGLQNITARAKKIGATIDVTTAPGSGTTISATWLRLRSVEPQIDLTDESMNEAIPR